MLPEIPPPNSNRIPDGTNQNIQQFSDLTQGCIHYSDRGSQYASEVYLA
jgi:hypothetical protein